MCNLGVGLGAVPWDGLQEDVELVEERLADVVVLVAIPKDVLGGGSGTFALFAFAFVVFNEPSLKEAVGRSNASANDRLKEAVKLRIFLEVELELAVAACLALRCWKAEVGHGGMSVEVGFDSHHVLAEAAFVFVRVVRGA